MERKSELTKALLGEKFKELVEEYSDGDITVDLFPDNQLGDDKTVAEGVQNGDIDIGISSSGNLSTLYKDYYIYDTPYLFLNSQEVYDVGFGGEAGQKILEGFDQFGLKGLAMWENGFRNVTTNNTPVNTVADLKGLKMRTNGMKTIDMTFQAMGATTTTIPYSDLYMGLKTGVADGQENPWVNVEGMKFYEVQKYFTEVNYQFHPDPFYVNAAWWNGLPEEYRDIITECATKMGEYNDELIDKNSSAAKQTIVDYGCEVYEPSADELKAFQAAVQSVYDQCVTEGICTADEIKEMQDIVAKA